jgi:hypothetical protein
MKLLRADKDQLVFKLTSGEKAVLLDVLKLYPRVPPGQHRLTRGKKDDTHAENQRLLDEALAEQRARNQRQLQALLERKETFQQADRAWQFTLRRGDFEWLLQVLNDVRVGSWIALGSPEELPRHLPADSATAATACAMELAGLFQMTFLETVEGEAGP